MCRDTNIVKCTNVLLLEYQVTSGNSVVCTSNVGSMRLLLLWRMVEFIFLFVLRKSTIHSFIGNCNSRARFSRERFMQICNIIRQGKQRLRDEHGIIEFNSWYSTNDHNDTDNLTKQNNKLAPGTHTKGNLGHWQRHYQCCGVCLTSDWFNVFNLNYNVTVKWQICARVTGLL